MNKEKFSIKNQLFNEHKLKLISEPLSEVYPAFRKELFVSEVLSEFPKLELKERISHIRKTLKGHLPDDYRQATEIMLNALPEPLDENKTDNDFGDFIYAPFSDFVAAYGCNEMDLEFSLNALKEITKRFSAEYSIRTFLNNFPEATLETLKSWAEDSNYHVRRLCSEGTRPKLPWAEKIKVKPEACLPILDKLYFDNTRFVTRSVANHLNDISKINPDLVLETLSEWQSKALQSEPEMNFIIKHALRTLVKNGNNKALSFLGHGDAEGIELLELECQSEVSIGDTLVFSFKLVSDAEMTAVIDYIMYFNSKSGNLSNKKVYKIKTLKLHGAESVQLTKKHPFKAEMSTRNLYPGKHRIEIQVNGKVLGAYDFILKV